MDLNDRILAVDDRVDNLAILQELLGDDYTLRCVDSGEEAIRVAPHFRPNLVLLDVMMPGLDGNETCRRLRAIPELADVKIVMLSARSGLHDRLASYDRGAVDYLAKPFDEREAIAKVRTWMRMVYNDKVAEIWRDAEQTRAAMGAALTTLASFRETETGDHLFRIRWYSQAIAEQLAEAGPYRQRVDAMFLQQLYRASPLHDIGKAGIDEAILRKRDVLLKSEFDLIARHTQIGHDILARAAEQLPDAGYLAMAAQIARHHHEHFDGSGYPDRLAGNEIPLAARIVSLADVFDALTSHRTSRGSLSVVEAAHAIDEEAGIQFDPAVVAAFRARLDDFRQAEARFADGCGSSNDMERIGGGADDRGVNYSADHVEYSRVVLDVVMS